ncbi:MAG: archease [Nitrospirota bacterium]|nr:archease [Nitrospirota bacterium]
MSRSGGFELLEPITGLGLRLWGSDLSTLFAQAARALTTLLTDADQIQPVEERLITIRAKDVDGLMVSWLNEIIFLFESEGFLVEAVGIHEIDQWHLRVAVLGEQYDPDRHHIEHYVKSASYAGLRVEQTPGGWEAMVHLAT